MTLSQKLAKGDDKLINVLVGCGINCVNCKHNKEKKTWSDGGLVCNNKFVSAPEITVCMDWIEGRPNA